MDELKKKLEALGLMIVQIDTDEAARLAPDNDQQIALAELVADMHEAGRSAALHDIHGLVPNVTKLMDDGTRQMLQDTFNAGILPGGEGVIVIREEDLIAVVDAAESNGKAEALSEIDRTPLPAPVVVESLDALDWARNAFPVDADRIATNATWLAGWFALAIEAGRQANKVQGLNGDDDGVALDQPEANAVCLYVTHDRSLSMEVDGRTRVRLGVVNSVQLVNDGNREVIVEPLDI